MANRFFPKYDTYKITSPFGKRTINGVTSQHNGIDLVAKTSSGGSATDSITAHTAGTVHEVGYDSSCGNFVVVEVATNVFMMYYHLREMSAQEEDTRIEKGEILGYMGSTGNSTGAHLHFGIKDNGKWIDPEPYLDKDYVVASSSSSSGQTSDTIPCVLGQNIRTIQTFLNAYYLAPNNKTLLVVDGSFGPASRKGLCMALQIELNKLGANLVVDGSFGPASQAAYNKYVNVIKLNSNSKIVMLWQCLVVGLGYNPNGIDSNFGNGCLAATNKVLNAKGKSSDGNVGSDDWVRCIA